MAVININNAVAYINYIVSLLLEYFSCFGAFTLS